MQAIELTPQQILDKIDGAMMAEFAGRVGEVIRGINAHGGKGEVNLKIIFDGSKGVDQVIASHAITSKNPTPKAKQRVFYTTPTGGLSDEDPMQATFKFVPGQEDGGVPR